jgi:SAM-dependent methyltransferase
MNSTAAADRPWHLSYQGEDAASWMTHGAPALFDEFMSAARLAPSGVHADLGCGNGIKTLAFASEGLRTVGIDLSIDALDEALRARGQQAVHYACARAEALPLADASVSSASDILMSTHLDGDDWERYKAELFRILRPGAHVLLVLFSLADRSFHGHAVTKRYVFQFEPGNAAMEGFEHYSGMVNVHFDRDDIDRSFGTEFEIVRAVQVHHPVYEERFLWNVILRKPNPGDVRV